MLEDQTMQKWIAVTGAVLMAVSCASSPRALEPPEVYVSSLRLLPDRNGQREMGVTLVLRNPNENPVELDAIDFSIRLGSEGFLEGSVNEIGSVPALGDLRVRTTVSGEFVSSASRLIAFLQGPESALPYEAEGTIWLDTRPRRDLRFEREGRVPLAISATP
jgi:hypothetical protein